MTTTEIQQKYATLAAKAGDLYFRLTDLNAQMTAIHKEKRDLEAALATATDEPVSN
jgi:hypothetical protein